MKRLVVPLLVASVVSCHIDKLLNGAKTPPSDAPPARVAFSSSLGSARAGEPIDPPVQVTVRDSAGHVTLRDTTITLSLGANPGGAKLGGDTLARSVNGVATFAGVWLDKAGSGYKLAATAPALHPDTSAAFSVMPASPTVLLFTVQPSSAMQDNVVKPPIQVTAYDSLGNKATNFGGSIQLRIGNDGSVSKNAGIAGAVVPAVAGVATFAEVKIDQVGVGYTLTAAFGNAAPVDTSVAFDITPGPPPPPPPPTHLGFTQQPQNTQAGAAITPPVQVVALDPAEHVVQGFTGAIGLALGPTSNGGTLSGGEPVNAVNGVATFPNLRVDKPGTSYTLRATASQLTDATSSAFNVTAPPPTTGDVTVTTATTGSNPPTSYTVTVDGGQSRTIPANGGSTTYSGLSATDHVVALTDVPANCTASGGASQTVTVPAGGTATAAFTITCTASTGTLNVTTSTTGTSQDPDGYTFAVDGGTPQPIGINQTIPLTGVAAASHTVVLSGVAGNCSVSGGTSRTVTVPAGGTATAAFAVSCTALPGSLAVSTSTSGASRDPDGYAFAVDGDTPQSIGINQTITLTGVAAGSHTVVLSGVAANCSVSGGTSQTVTVPAGGTATAAFSVSCTALPGSLAVSTSTSGASQDPDGYAFAVDGGTPQSIGVNQTITLTGVAAGSHTVVLSGVAANCSVSGGTSQTVTVPAGGTATVAFSVSCTALPGSLSVSTSTSGASQDPDGYAFAVDGGTPQSIGVNQTITLTGVAAGSHTVVLSGVASNCTVTNGTSRTVTVPAGGSVTASFAVSCTALTGSLVVTTSTTGGSPDPNGYTFAVDGGASQPIQTNQTITLTGVTAASHTVQLGDVASNCTVTGGTSRTVSVPAGGSATASFPVSCPTPNQPPIAAFSSSCTLLVCNFTSTSSDPDGSIVSYSWTFGDGGTSTDQNPTHVYTAPGGYTVSLTVTDNQGATASVSHPVTLSAPPNQPPIVTAGGDQTVLVGLVFTLSGASFSDPDHDAPWSVTIDWGDGTQTIFSTPTEGSIGGSHSYPVTLLPHDYTLTVTVVDAHGGRNSATKTVHVVVA